MSEKITAKNFKKEVNNFKFSEMVAKQKKEAFSTVMNKASQYKYIALQMMYLSGRSFEKEILDDPRKYKPKTEDVNKWLKIYGGDKYLSKIVTFGKKEKIKEFTKEKIKFNGKKVDASLLKVYPGLYEKGSFDKAFDFAEYPDEKAGKYYDSLKDFSVDVLTNKGLHVVNSWLKDHSNTVPQWKKAILARKKVSPAAKKAAKWGATKKFTKFTKEGGLYKIGNGKAKIAPGGADFYKLTGANSVQVTEGNKMYEIVWNGKDAYTYSDGGPKKGKKFYLKHKGTYILSPVSGMDVETKADKNKDKTGTKIAEDYLAKKEKAKKKTAKSEKAKLLKPVDNFLNRVAEAEVWMSKIQEKYKLELNFSPNKAEYLAKLKSSLVLDANGKTFEDFVNEGGHKGYNRKENLETYYGICDGIKVSQLKNLESFKNALILSALGGGINELGSESEKKAQLAKAVKKVPEIKIVDEKIKELEKGVSK